MNIASMDKNMTMIRFWTMGDDLSKAFAAADATRPPERVADVVAVFTMKDTDHAQS